MKSKNDKNFGVLVKRFNSVVLHGVKKFVFLSSLDSSPRFSEGERIYLYEGPFATLHFFWI